MGDVLDEEIVYRGDHLSFGLFVYENRGHGAGGTGSVCAGGRVFAFEFYDESVEEGMGAEFLKVLYVKLYVNKGFIFLGTMSKKTPVFSK